jgi:hypothetical protein
VGQFGFVAPVPRGGTGTAPKCPDISGRYAKLRHYPGRGEPTATSKSGFSFSQIAEKKKINANVDLFRLLKARPDGRGQIPPSASGFQQWRQAIWKI